MNQVSEQSLLFQFISVYLIDMAAAQASINVQITVRAINKVN